MKKTIKYIFAVIISVIIVCILMYNPYYQMFETRMSRSNICAVSCGEYYYISGNRLFKENEKEPLIEGVSQVVPCKEGLLLTDEYNVWIYDAVKKEKKFLWETPNVSEFSIVCDYLGDEAFALCGNNEEGYIVRGNTGEVFYGRTGEVTEKDGFVYNFSYPCMVTDSDGGVTGIYKPVFRKDFTVYTTDIYSKLLLEKGQEKIFVSAPEGYTFLPENVFSDGEKVFVLVQHKKDSKTVDELLVLNPETCKLEKTDMKIEGRVVTFEKGKPLVFKNGAFTFEGKEISRMPMKTRGVKTVCCGEKVFIFNDDGGYVGSFEI